MAITVKDIDTLQAYIEGVMERADHHAGKVNEVALTIAGAIVWKKDERSIKVMERAGETKNVLWVTIGSNKYAFSYNHELGKIEMREKSIQGKVLHEFDNSTTASEVKNIFEKL